MVDGRLYANAWVDPHNCLNKNTKCHCALMLKASKKDMFFCFSCTCFSRQHAVLGSRTRTHTKIMWYNSGFILWICSKVNCHKGDFSVRTLWNPKFQRKYRCLTFGYIFPFYCKFLNSNARTFNRKWKAYIKEWREGEKLYMLSRFYYLLCYSISTT